MQAFFVLKPRPAITRETSWLLIKDGKTRFEKYHQIFFHKKSHARTKKEGRDSTRMKNIGANEGGKHKSVIGLKNSTHKTWLSRHQLPDIRLLVRVLTECHTRGPQALRGYWACKRMSELSCHYPKIELTVYLPSQPRTKPSAWHRERTGAWSEVDDTE